MKTNPFDYISAGLFMALIFITFVGAATYLGENQGVEFTDNNDLIDADLLVDKVDSLSESVKTITVESQNWFVATISSIVELPSIIKSLLEMFMFFPELIRRLIVFVGVPVTQAAIITAIITISLVAGVFFLLYKYTPQRIF